MKILEEMKKRMKISDIWHFGILIAFLVAIFYFGYELEFNYREIIICSIIASGLVVLLGLQMWLDIEFHRFAFVFIIIVGSLSLVVQPILNIADETTHFARSEWVSRGNLLVDSEQTEYEIIQSVNDLQKNVKRSYVSSDVKGKKIDASIVKTGHIAASNASFLYIPQAIGILIAKVLNLDVIWMLWLGRFANLVCYALGITVAIKISPKLKKALFFVSVLPMSIHQAASCSPDAFINMTAILIIAYFLYLYCSENDLTWKQVSIFIGLSCIIAISKVTNIFMAGLILLLPSKKFNSRKKAFLSKCMVIGGAIVCGGMCYLYITRFPASAEHLEYLNAANVSSYGQVKYIITNFSEWICKFGMALITKSENYTQTLSSFGWLEYNNSLIPIMTLFLFGKICAKESGIHTNRINKILLFLMVIGIYIATNFAMYVSWTPVGSTDIAGVQGRYFIPMIALSTLLLTSSDTEGVQQQSVGDMIALLGMNGVMLIVTAVKFY